MYICFIFIIFLSIFQYPVVVIALFLVVSKHFARAHIYFMKMSVAMKLFCVFAFTNQCGINYSLFIIIKHASECAHTHLYSLVERQPKIILFT